MFTPCSSIAPQLLHIQFQQRNVIFANEEVFELVLASWNSWQKYSEKSLKLDNSVVSSPKSQS